MTVPVKIARRAFNVEDYHRMAEAGILGEDDRRGEHVCSTILPALSLKVDDILG